MEFVTQLIRKRKSIRSYDERPLNPSDLDRLMSYAHTIENPYGIPVEFRLLDARTHGLSSPVISGEQLYLAAKLDRVPHAEEALGYSMELLMLYALSLGMGTVWIGGTMDRKLFEKAMELGDGQFMPCVTPLGYPAKKPSFRETMMRKGVKADRRHPFESLFFDGALDSPLMAGSAGRLAEPLEMVRLAPSAVNKQPWRVIVTAHTAHFYLKPGRGFGDGPAGNMQKIDLGIALCHFDLAARQNGLGVKFSLKDPGLVKDSDLVYIASYLF